MSYTAPAVSGSTWAVYQNSYIEAPNHIRTYTGEFRGNPNQNPQNDMQQSCSFACDSNPDCSAWTHYDNDGAQTCIIANGTTTRRSVNRAQAYVRTSARPTGKYATIAQGVTLSTVGGHTCQGDGWSQDGEGTEVQNSGGNRYCIEPYPRPSRCPSDLGPPVTGKIVNKTNGAGVNYATGQGNVGVTCTYNSVPQSVMWDDGKMAGYFGGNNTSGTTQEVRKDWCDANATYASLATSNDNCARFYTANGNLNAKYLLRIISEKATTWPDDQAMRERVLSIAVGSSPSAGDAMNMINQYCLVDNPEWPENNNMRTFINNLYSSGPNVQTNQDLKYAASTIIDHYCQSHQSSERCACKNAINQGISGCVANPNIPGCADLVQFNDNLSGAPDAFNSLIGSIRQSAKPICLSSACRTAATDPAGKYLRTADDVTLTCPDNINLCLSSVKVKGNISASAQIVQDCSIAVNYSGPNPMTPASGGLNVSGGAQAIQDSTGTRVTATPATTTYNTPSPASTGGAPPSSPAGTPVTTGTDGSTLLITNPAVANVLNTKTKQYGAIGGCIFIIICLCIIIIALMSGDDSGGPSGPSASNIALARLASAGS